MTEGAFITLSLQAETCRRRFFFMTLYLVEAPNNFAGSEIFHRSYELLSKMLLCYLGSPRWLQCQALYQRCKATRKMNYKKPLRFESFVV